MLRLYGTKQWTECVQDEDAELHKNVQLCICVDLKL
jgi:hypothetical protein